MPNSTRQIRQKMAPRRNWVSMSMSLVGVQRHDDEVDQLDEDKGGDDPTDAVNEDVAAQDGLRTRWPPLDTAEGERNQGDDDQRVEDDRREHSALRTVELHDVQGLELRVDHHEQRRNDGEVLGHVV